MDELVSFGSTRRSAAKYPQRDMDDLSDQAWNRLDRKDYWTPPIFEGDKELILGGQLRQIQQELAKWDLQEYLDGFEIELGDQWWKPRGTAANASSLRPPAPVGLPVQVDSTLGTGASGATGSTSQQTKGSVVKQRANKAGGKQQSGDSDSTDGTSIGARASRAAKMSRSMDVPSKSPQAVDAPRRKRQAGDSSSQRKPKRAKASASTPLSAISEGLEMTEPGPGSLAVPEEKPPPNQKPKNLKAFFLKTVPTSVSEAFRVWRGGWPPRSMRVTQEMDKAAEKIAANSKADGGEDEQSKSSGKSKGRKNEDTEEPSKKTKAVSMVCTAPVISPSRLTNGQTFSPRERIVRLRCVVFGFVGNKLLTSPIQMANGRCHNCISKDLACEFCLNANGSSIRASCTECIAHKVGCTDAGSFEVRPDVPEADHEWLKAHIAETLANQEERRKAKTKSEPESQEKGEKEDVEMAEVVAVGNERRSASPGAYDYPPRTPAAMDEDEDVESTADAEGEVDEAGDETQAPTVSTTKVSSVVLGDGS